MSRLNLRQKLMVIVGTVVAAFLILSVTGWVFDEEVIRQMDNIRDQYIPLIELGYHLDTQFEAIGLGFRDAVSAQDMAAMVAVEEAQTKLLAELEAAKRIIDPGLIDESKAAVERYFNVSRETSLRLMKAEAGMPIIDAMAEMQAKRAQAESLLKKIASFDRARLSGAFASALRAQTWAARLRLWCSVACLAFIIIVSAIIGHDIVIKFTEISKGLVRFGQGDFQQQIQTHGKDELAELGQRINLMAERIQGLMKEIESFSYSVAHDLRAPLRSILGFSTVLIEDFGTTLAPEAKSSLDRISAAAQRMGQMVDGLLNLSRLNRVPVEKQSVNLSKVALRIVEELQSADPDRVAKFDYPENITAMGDPKLVEVVFSNLLGNAWKFTKKRVEARIEFGVFDVNHNGLKGFFVSDNGAGFDMRYSDKLFGTFQRLHSANEFEGHGIGLATVKSIISRHGGRIWAESELGKGTTFFFTFG